MSKEQILKWFLYLISKQMVAIEIGTHPFNLMHFYTLQTGQCYVFSCQRVLYNWCKNNMKESLIKKIMIWYNLGLINTVFLVFCGCYSCTQPLQLRFSWEMVIYVIMRNNIALVFKRHLPFGWLQARFTDMNRILLCIRILNCTSLSWYQ